MSPELRFGPIAPVLIVGVGSLVVLVLELYLSARRSVLGRAATPSLVSSTLSLVSAFFLAAALLASWHAFGVGDAGVFNPAHPLVRLDRLASFSIALVALGSLLACLLSVGYLAELRIQYGEYYALLLLATSGMMLLVQATDMVMIFLGLEIMSIPIYVLAGFDRKRLGSNESALKYFLVGSFASAILLYGMALLYGATGHTDLAGIGARFDPESPLALVGLGMVLVGFTFKISSVPFHQWTPDVYEGAPTSVTAWMSVTVKVAAFAALLRILVEGFAGAGTSTGLGEVLWVLTAATLVIGNFTAIVQDNVKRMLAYSSIAHAGYLLIGFVAGTQQAYAAVLFYLLVYLFMNLGAFAVVVALAEGGRDRDRIEDFRGLAQRRPALAALMTLFMLALAGIPGTGGFVAKFLIFEAAVSAGHVGLAILGVLTAVVSVYYYLRIPVAMYMQEPAEASAPRSVATGEGLVLAVCAIAVIVLGLFPNAGPLAALGWIRALDWTRQTVAMLF